MKITFVEQDTPKSAIGYQSKKRWSPRWYDIYIDGKHAGSLASWDKRLPALLASGDRGDIAKGTPGLREGG